MEHHGHWQAVLWCHSAHDNLSRRGFIFETFWVWLLKHTHTQNNLSFHSQNEVKRFQEALQLLAKHWWPDWFCSHSAERGLVGSCSTARWSETFACELVSISLGLPQRPSHLWGCQWGTGSEKTYSFGLSELTDFGNMVQYLHFQLGAFSMWCADLSLWLHQFLIPYITLSGQRIRSWARFHSRVWQPSEHLGCVFFFRGSWKPCDFAADSFWYLGGPRCCFFLLNMIYSPYESILVNVYIPPRRKQMITTLLGFGSWPLQDTLRIWLRGLASDNIGGRSPACKKAKGDAPIAAELEG